MAYGARAAATGAEFAYAVADVDGVDQSAVAATFIKGSSATGAGSGGHATSIAAGPAIAQFDNAGLITVVALGQADATGEDLESPWRLRTQPPA